MFSYQSFLATNFPPFAPYFNSLATSIPPLTQVKSLASRYLELNCSSIHGYSGETHNFLPDSDSTSIQPNPICSIPTPYDSACLLSLLKHTDINPKIIQILTSVIKENRKPSGFWNYFISEPTSSEDLFPDDIDGTAVNIMALYLTGNITIEECRLQASKLLQVCLYNDSGVISTWLNTQEENQRKVVYGKYTNYPKLCAGSLANLLWFLATCKMDKENGEKLEASIKFVENCLDVLISRKDKPFGVTEVDKELRSCTYYPNKYVMYWFLARYFSASEMARKRFGEKFVNLLREDLEGMISRVDEDKQQQPMDIALMIIAVIYMKLHEDQGFPEISKGNGNVGEVRKWLKELVKWVVKLQDKDGAWPAWVLFSWNRPGLYGGSKVFTTGCVLAAIGMVEREIGEVEI